MLAAAAAACYCLGLAAFCPPRMSCVVGTDELKPRASCSAALAVLRCGGAKEDVSRSACSRVRTWAIYSQQRDSCRARASGRTPNSV